MSSTIKLFFLSFIFFSSCAQGVITNDAGLAGETDASEEPCIPPPGVSNDWCTSGNFNGPCDPPYADRTKNGYCVCGTSNFPCSQGTNCRFGTCVQADLSGQECEFDGYQTGNNMPFGGDCDSGFLCVEGHCTFYECAPEKCDGIDNDCDGKIDEADDDMPLRQLCLGNGPVPEIINLPCQAGRRECISGTWTECLDDIPPFVEQGLLACNLSDDDCDGCVDGVRQQDGTCEQREPGQFDVLFIMDISGSMSVTIQSVITAVNNFATNFINNPTFKFGIVLLSDIGVLGGQGTLYLDLTDFNTFAAALAAMPTHGAGTEPQWDTIYELASGELAVTWSPEATRIIVLFTDETGQTSRIERGLLPISETEMCNSLQHGEVLASFIDLQFTSSFDECGTIFDISASDMIETNLETQVLVNPCI